MRFGNRFVNSKCTPYSRLIVDCIPIWGGTVNILFNLVLTKWFFGFHWSNNSWGNFLLISNLIEQKIEIAKFDIPMLCFCMRCCSILENILLPICGLFQSCTARTFHDSNFHPIDSIWKLSDQSVFIGSLANVFNSILYFRFHFAFWHDSKLFSLLFHL